MRWVPNANLPTCQLLSNHYNKTRSSYYKRLDDISKSGGDLTGFVEYALQGFVDGIREQIDIVQEEQVRVIWVNHIHASFAEKATVAGKRRRDLALTISKKPEPRKVDDVLSENTRLARVYAQLDSKTMTRDLNELIKMDLIRRDSKRRVRPNRSIITAFLPWRNEEG